MALTETLPVATVSRRPDRLQRLLPKLVLAPTAIAMVVCLYGYMLWTAVISFTNSRFLPSYNFAGFAQYARLMENDRWLVACKNLAIFGGLFILLSLALASSSPSCWTSASAAKASSAPSICTLWRYR